MYVKVHALGAARPASARSTRRRSWYAARRATPPPTKTDGAAPDVAMRRDEPPSADQERCPRGRPTLAVGVTEATRAAPARYRALAEVRADLQQKSAQRAAAATKRPAARACYRALNALRAPLHT